MVLQLEQRRSIIVSSSPSSLLISSIIVTVIAAAVVVANGSSYTYTYGNDQFYITTGLSPIDYNGAKSYCDSLPSSSSKYVPGLVRSANQDQALQAYIRSMGITGCWSGAYSTGYTTDTYYVFPWWTTDYYYKDFYWNYGYGEVTTDDTRSRRGTVIHNGYKNANSPATSIVYNSNIGYPQDTNLGAYWSGEATVGLRSRSRSSTLTCAICVISACNYDDDPSLRANGMLCGGRGTSGFYPSCGCICRKGWAGPVCTASTFTRSSLTISLSITQSLPVTQSQSLTQSHTEIRSTTTTNSHSWTPTWSMPITTSHSIPNTFTEPHTHTTTPTLSHTVTWSGLVSDSLSLQYTHSYTITQSADITNSISTTISDAITDSLTLSLSTSTTISYSLSTSSSPTTSSSLSGSFSTSLTTSSTLSPTTSLSVSFSTSLTTSYSISASTSLSPSTSASGTGTVTITVSPSEGSVTYTTSISESTSISSNCGIFERVYGAPGLCIMTNTSGRDDGLECNASKTVMPVPTALVVNVSSPEATPADQSVPMNEAAVLSVSADDWAAGNVIAAAVHLALPLRMRNHWGNALESASIGPDGLVEVTSFITETSRRGVGRVLGSTTIRFYRFRGRELIPGGGGEWNTLPPGNASATGPGRAQVADLLSRAPEGRLGMVVVYNGPRNDNTASKDDSEMFFELDDKVIECGERMDRLAFGVRLMGRVTLASAISEISQQALDALQTIGSVTAAFTLMPTVVLQLGVQGSIREMAECQDWWIDVDEAGVGAYRIVNLIWLSGTKLQSVTSPYGLAIPSLGPIIYDWVPAIGNSSSSSLIQPARERAVSELESMGQYYRGAIISSWINLAAFTMILVIGVLIIYIGRRCAGLLDPASGFVQDVLDAAALLQVPSVFLVGMSLLMDGMAEGSTTLMSIRIMFAAEPDGYASVYRTTALEAGVPGQTLMSSIDGYMTAPGWTDVGKFDIILASLSLLFVSLFILHVLYVVTGKRLAVVLESLGNNITPTVSSDVPTHSDDDDKDPFALSTGDNVGRARNSSFSSKSGSDAHFDDKRHEAPVNRRLDRRRSVSFVLNTSLSTPVVHPQSDSAASGGLDNWDVVSVIDDPTASPHTPTAPGRWKALWLHWFELREHWVPPGDESIGGPAYEAGVSWMRKYGMYVGGTTWAPYMVFELSIAFVVTALEGYVTSDRLHCTMKCTIALVLLGCQLVALLFLRPISARFDLRITILSLGLSFIVGALITINIMIQNVYLTILADMITVVASMVAAAFGIAGGINSILSIVDVLRTVKGAIVVRRLKLQVAAEAKAAEAEQELQVLTVPHQEPLDDRREEDNEPEELVNEPEGDPPEPTEEEEREFWDGYLVELETGPIQPPDEEGDAMRDAILSPNVLPTDDKKPDPSLELLTDLMAAKPKEEEDWDTFLNELQEAEEEDL